jgi:hypothetical protein
MKATRRIGNAILLIVIMSAALTLISGGTAFADTHSSHGSCMGFEASALSPPGSSDEAPGGMPDLHAFFATNFPGVPQGAFISFIAHLHEGSHADCDEAIE